MPAESYLEVCTTTSTQRSHYHRACPEVSGRPRPLGSRGCRESRQSASRPVEARSSNSVRPLPPVGCDIVPPCSSVFTSRWPFWATSWPSGQPSFHRHRGHQARVATRRTTSGAIGPGIDLRLLSDRVCQSMLHVGVGVSHMTPGEEQVPELRLRICLTGLRRRHLERGTRPLHAIQAVEKVVVGWEEEPDDE